MTPIPDRKSNVSPFVDAALLLAARDLLRHYGLPHPTSAAILEATGAGRTRAYELAGELSSLLPTLERPVGRPRNRRDDPGGSRDNRSGSGEPGATSPPSPQDAVLDYIMANPGCVSRRSRNRYSRRFRHFIVQLRERYSSMLIERFARAVHVPLKTLQGWLRDLDHALAGPPAGEHPHDGAKEPENRPSDGHPERPSALGPVSELRIQTVLTEWQAWKGTFVEFCNHLRENCFIEIGRTAISTILACHGMRTPARRPGRSPDEVALRGAFETFFPGAQWVGDGHQIALELNGTRYELNLELFVDAYSAALIGGHIGEQEDSSAVVDAFSDGVATAGEPPLAVLLDNRASNHTPDVQESLGDTLLIRSTTGRAQNKAHVEGAFGLFEQTAPPLRIDAGSPQELAAQIVALLVMVWGRTLNTKKLPARGNRSRVELHRQAQPTAEEIARARDLLAQRQRQQERARQTQLARQDPLKRELLAREFRALHLTDPDGNVQLAIARYPLDAIIDAFAVFKAKKSADTLPDGAGPRYLLGIVRNISAHNEQRHLVDELLRLRLQVHDSLLQHLVTERQVLHGAEPQTAARIDLFVDRALPTDSLITRLFWLRSAAEEISASPELRRTALVRRAAARITTSYRVPVAARQQAICYLASLVFPSQ